MLLIFNDYNNVVTIKFVERIIRLHYLLTINLYNNSNFLSVLHILLVGFS